MRELKRGAWEDDEGEGEEEWIDPALVAVLAREEGTAAVNTLGFSSYMYCKLKVSGTTVKHFY